MPPTARPGAMTARMISGGKSAEVGNGTITMLSGLRHGDHRQDVTSVVVDLKVYLSGAVLVFDSAEGREKRFGTLFQGILIRTGGLVCTIGKRYLDSTGNPVFFGAYT